MSLNDVSKLLWRERELLELLLFKLDEEHMIVAAGRTRWLVHAAREVEMVLDEVRRLELERAVVLDEVWAELALRQVPTLEGLARSTSGPWPQIFDGHRAALVALTREVRGVAATTLDFLERGHATTRDALRALSVDRVNVDLVEEATS